MEELKSRYESELRRMVQFLQSQENKYTEYFDQIENTALDLAMLKPEDTETLSELKNSALSCIEQMEGVKKRRKVLFNLEKVYGCENMSFAPNGLAGDIQQIKLLATYKKAMERASMPNPSKTSMFREYERLVWEELHPGKRYVPAGEEDEDIEVEDYKESFKCPISMKEFEVPVYNDVCKHTYEEDAINKSIDNQPQIRCPVAGCTSMVSRNMLKPDRGVMRRMYRTKLMQKLKPEQKQFTVVGQEDDDDDAMEED
ncbi:hypothetical protein MP638_004588 [Amoeboaphelidium occidentale]|nr:hypothetical protein MP638_004588 [Amoeboaphelidium occidentale]